MNIDRAAIMRKKNYEFAVILDLDGSGEVILFHSESLDLFMDYVKNHLKVPGREDQLDQERE